MPPLKKLKTTEELDSIILEAENSLENMRKNKVDSEVERIYITKVQGAIIQKNIVKNFDKLKKEIYGNIIFIGELRIILLNGEFFYSISEKICKNISKKTIFIGYTGGLVGYVPDSESFDDPGYEVLSSIFEKGVDNIIIEKVNLFL